MSTRWLAATALVVACSKASPPAGGSAAAPSALAAVSAAPAAGSARVAQPAAVETFAGSYVAKVGPVEPPAAAREKAWSDDPGTAAVGKGNIEIAVERPAGGANGPPGKVSGEAKGALGDMGIAGTFDGHELRAILAPKEANAAGAMSGYMTLTADGPALKGTLRVANSNARVVREAKVELAPR